MTWIVSASSNVCQEYIDVLDGINCLLDSEESDRFDESIQEESTVHTRLEEPFECVQVVMSMDMEHQVLMSKEFSQDQGPWIL